MIYYLAHPYSNNPEESVKNAKIWLKRLVMVHGCKFRFFSPILHSHYLYLDDPTFWTPLPNEQIEPFDWVALDLAFLEGWCVYQEEANGYGREIGSEACPFQPRVTMLLSRTAVHDDYDIHAAKFLFRDKIPSKMWTSEGCKKEYEFAKEHHIRVLELEAFLDGKEVEL